MSRAATTANTLAFSILIIVDSPDAQTWFSEDVIRKIEGKSINEWEYNEHFPKLVEVVAVLACLMRSYRVEAVRLEGESGEDLTTWLMSVARHCDFQMLLRMRDADCVRLSRVIVPCKNLVTV
ncbi:uncharacterized protein BDR25DRAFT_310395 [Lindgomyces ingoldianus]|uniref:Uncharacterized protein n=1 Tax=Lindgomyces ingoldianus TaxID=673940 RepID=A0ACB6RB43_9PLEO|nr:uncharacterized protein BDR25DRAFT_310395 [Lindgomyces ingoldianus]KAF2475973.1 hypothetical protein BDR25DRAFT_310395 [Lindgomyces ingoldianus]